MFDRSFDIGIDRRFQAIEDLAHAIRALELDENNSVAINTQAAIEKIRAKIITPSQESIRQKMRLLVGIMQTLNRTLSEVSSLFNNVFNTTQTGYTSKSADLEIRNTIGLIYQDNPNIKFIINYIARIAGNEAILFEENKILFRCDANKDTSNIVVELKEILKSYVICQLEKASNV